MFEGVVAGILNRLLGKYIQDLDTENLNVGIFSGNVSLADLKLKPEALYELDLPIDVKIGTIGKINFQIPWNGLYTQPVVMHLEDILILVGPAISNTFFDAEREKRLIRAAKRKILQDLELESEVLAGPKNFYEQLFTAIVDNVQIYIRNVHIRYEDSVTSKDGPLACGLCLQSLSIETTNSKWKPSVTSQGASTVYQMMKVESLSLYWNPRATVLDDEETMHITPIQYYNWKHYMVFGLEKFSMHKEDFEFLLKPATCKVKVIVNRSGEARVPKLLVDAVVQDSALQLSRRQYLSIANLMDSFPRMTISRKFRDIHPRAPVKSNASKWWKFAYTAVTKQRIRPYTWQAIKAHRDNYNKCKQTYKSTLRSPNDTELKLDLQKCEDSLPIVSIVMAREQAKIELLNQEEQLVMVRETEAEWWKGTSKDESTRKTLELAVQTEKSKSLWSHLSSPEKKKMCELIGYVEGTKKSDKPKQYIEHKLNLTLGNCSLSLLNRRREVLVVTLTQFLVSLETRPTAKAYKLSARAESMVVEGAGDKDMVVLLDPDLTSTSAASNNLLAVDLERHPLNSDADYGLSCCLEPLELIYNMHAYTEIIKFFQTRSMTTDQMLEGLAETIDRGKELATSVASYAIARKKTFNLSFDLKSVYLVVPESGTMTGCATQLVIVEVVRVVVRSELQPPAPALEDATCMELEERLYDRLHAECCLQIMLCSSDLSWRDLKKPAEPERHIVPKVKVQVVFSNSIKEDYRLLPRYKLNVTVSSLRLNLSDRVICRLLEFFETVPLPIPNAVPVSLVDSGDYPDNALDPELATFLARDNVDPEPSYKVLWDLRQRIVVAHLMRTRSPEVAFDKAAAKQGFLEADKTFVSSEHSDEDMEMYARSVDLPGFDDNVSPNNTINTLMRFVIGEIVVNLARSVPQNDTRYLTLAVGKVCVDAALMEYGPALQLSVRSVALTDWLHVQPAGRPLTMVVGDGEPELLNVLYRKVRANCPEFKSHFHSVEQSLVVDLGAVSLAVHGDALRTLVKFLKHTAHKVQSRRFINIKDIVVPRVMAVIDQIMGGELDPPVPSGATKFSYSVRLNQLKAKLCHIEADLMELRIGGLESDCVFRANDRMIFKLFLNTIHADDLYTMTLYPKLLWLDEDKVFEMKYVRHSPRPYCGRGAGERIECDGSLRLYLGRLHAVVLCKHVAELQQFIEPLLPMVVGAGISQRVRRRVVGEGESPKIQLAVDLHLPALLLPQKQSSPDLIVFNTGDLTVENFFKEIPVPHEDGASLDHKPVLDNILVKLENVTLSRAVMTLAGTLEVQEPILEPMSLKLDMKRVVSYHKALAALRSGCREALQLEVVAAMDSVGVNLGQRDLATLLAVCGDNLAERGADAGHILSPMEPAPVDASVQKLQMFFAQTEPIRKESTLRFSLEGVELKLFSDMDEVLSSPVRDMNRGLARLSAGEVDVYAERHSDGSILMKGSLQSLLVEDIRPDPSIVIKRVFQSHGGEKRYDSSIAVSMPPIVDANFRRSHAGDRTLDLHVEKTRLNVSAPFFIHLARFISEAMPGDKTMEGGVVNHGYVAESSAARKEAVNNNVRAGPPSADCAGAYYSTGALASEDSPGMSIAVQFRKPEIMFFTGLSKTEGHALLMRADLLIDYSYHSNRETLNVSLAGLQMMSKLQSKLEKLAPQLVLMPCDVEYSRSVRSVEEGVRVAVSMSSVDVHLAATTVHAVTDILEEIRSELYTPEDREHFNFMTYDPKAAEKDEDLWGAKKLMAPLDLAQEETCVQAKFRSIRPPETFNLIVPCIKVMFELEGKKRIPLLMFKSAVEATLQDWSRQTHGRAELSLQASYFNERLSTWEPFIEPVAHGENICRPWELLVKIFQAKAYPMASKLDTNSTGQDLETENVHVSPEARGKRSGFESETSADDNDASDNEMTFVRSPKDCGNRDQICDGDAGLLGAFNEDDSDSENDNGMMDKLAAAISHLLTDDGSGQEASEPDSSGGEDSGPEPEPDPSADNAPYTDDVAGRSGDHKAVTLLERERTVSADSGLDSDNYVEKTCTYIVANARDVLNVTVTPRCADVISELLTSFNNKTTVSNVVMGFENPVNLLNDIGPGSTVHLITRAETTLAGKDRILAVADYDQDTSRPSTPGDPCVATLAEEDDVALVESDWNCFEGGFSAEVNTPTPSPLYSPTLTASSDPVAQLYRKVTDERLVIKQAEFEELTVVCPQRDVSKLHVLQPGRNGARYYVVVDTQSVHGNRRIVVRSPLQIRNETSFTLELFYKKSDLQAIGVDPIGELTNPFDDKLRLAMVPPDSTFNIPLFVAYHCRLYLLPNNFECQTACQGVWWVDLANDLTMPRDVICPAKDGDETKIFAMRIVTVEGCPSDKVTRAIPNFLMRVVPPLAIYNRLPYAAQISIPSLNYQIRIEAGERTYTYQVNLLKTHRVTVDIHYYGLPWTGSFSLTTEVVEKVVAMATDCETDGGNKQLGVSVKVERNESWEVYLHAPFWIINKTGLPLQMRPSRCDTIYEVGAEPLLYSGARRGCARRPGRAGAVRLRAHHSRWSRPFAMTVGVPGLVVCTHAERRARYRILLTVTLSELCPQLTKIVTLLPYVVVHNETKRHLRFMEENEAADLWIDLQPSQCVPFWPETDSMRMHCKFRDSSLVSRHFVINAAHFTVLRMDRGTALSVEVAGGTDKPLTVIFKAFVPGDAPVRIDNACSDIFIKLQQGECGQGTLVNPGHSTLYTWDDPAEERALAWTVYNYKGKQFVADFSRDGFGEEKICFDSAKQTLTNSVTSKLSSTLKMLTPKSPDQFSSSSEDSDAESPFARPRLGRKDTVIYWTSFMEDNQRVFALTEDERIANAYRRKVNPEKSTYEIYTSLSGIGLSICVQNKLGVKELAYVSLLDSLPRWEVNVSHKWKVISPDLTAWIEDRYNSDQKKCQLKEYIHIDFDKMQMTKPFFSELKRTYVPAVWIQFRQAETYNFVHMKINRLQVDNQLNEAVFPTVLHPTPLAANVKHKPKPCIELLALKQYRQSLNQDLYKYIKILVQEFSLNIDRGFVNYIFDILNQWKVEAKPAVRLRADLALIHRPLHIMAVKSQLNIKGNTAFEYCHMSPLKIRLSLSSRGYEDNMSSPSRKFGNKKENRPKLFNSDLLEYLFNSWGASLCDVRDLTIRTTYMDLFDLHAPKSAVLSVSARYYWLQLMQQFHVLVLSSKVLVNPYSISCPGPDIDFMYYEPCAGNLIGQEEISCKLSYGVSALLGHCASGAARAASIFAQVVSECPTTLYFDDDYRKKSKYELGVVKSTDLPKALVDSSRAFTTALALAISGLIARPTFDVYKEAASLSRQLDSCGGGGVSAELALRFAVQRQGRLTARARLPRHCHTYEGVRPYCRHEALGARLLCCVARGHYADTDAYLAHAPLHPSYNYVATLTTRRLLMIRCGGGAGSWHVEWAVNLDELIGVPTLQGGKLLLTVRQNELVNYFATDEKVIDCGDPEILAWLQAKIESALILNMEDKRCPAEI